MGWQAFHQEGLLLDDLDDIEEPPLTNPKSRYRVVLEQQELVYRADLRGEMQSALESCRAVVGGHLFGHAWEKVHPSIREQVVGGGSSSSGSSGSSSSSSGGGGGG